MASKKDESDIDYTLENPATLTKLQTASEISHRVLEKVKALCVDEANVLEICIQGDSFLDDETSKVYKGKKISKGIGFPTAISLNNCVAHFSPLPSDPESKVFLKSGDIVKIALGAQIDGFAANLADTIVVPGKSTSGDQKSNEEIKEIDETSPSEEWKVIEGRKADVLTAAWLASEAAIRLIKPGAKNWEVTEAVAKIAASFDCKPMEGMLTHQQERNIIDGKKQVILNPSDEQRKSFETHIFAENEIYGVDILISTGAGKAKPRDVRTTMYKRTGTTYALKMQTSRKVFSEIQRTAGEFPFVLRGLEDEKKARFAVGECVTHGLLTPYDVLYEKEGEFVAQFETTIALTKNGTVRLAGPSPLDISQLKTDKKLENEELLKLIMSPLKPNKKKNKKKKKVTEEDNEEDEEGK